MKNKNKLLVALGFVSLSILPCFSKQLNVSADVTNDYLLEHQRSNYVNFCPFESIEFYIVNPIGVNEIFSVSINSAPYLPTATSDMGNLTETLSIYRANSLYKTEINANVYSYDSSQGTFNYYVAYYRIRERWSFSLKQLDNNANVFNRLTKIVFRMKPFLFYYNHLIKRDYNVERDFYFKFLLPQNDNNYVKYNYYNSSYVEEKIYPSVKLSELKGRNSINDTLPNPSDISINIPFTNDYTLFNSGVFLELYTDSANLNDYNSLYFAFETFYFSPDLDLANYSTFFSDYRESILEYGGYYDNSFNFSSFLSSSIGGFFDFEIIGISLADIMYIIIGLSLLIIILKMFLGG